MDLPIIDRIQEQAKKANEATKDRAEKTRDQFKELQTKYVDTLKEQAGRSRRTISKVELQALGTVERMLERLHKVTGERAEFLDKGRSFIDQAAQDIRKGNLTVDDLPITDYDALGVKKIAEQLPQLSLEDREMIRAYEQAHKNRVSVYRVIDRQEKLEKIN